MTKQKILILLIIMLIMMISSTITTYIITNQYGTNKNTNVIKKIPGKKSELYTSTQYQQIRELIYPVGSIYISVTDDTVAKVQARFGGTWEVFSQGKTLVGVNNDETEFNTVLKTGGEKTHRLTIQELPKHRHTVIHAQWESRIDTIHNQSTGSIFTWNGSDSSITYKTPTTDLSANANDMLTTGGNTAHNNLPPYITVYMYKRTA